MRAGMAVTDGLGERRSARDKDGGEIDQLCIRKEIAAVPSFEFALRERVSRLASFRHPSYARVRSVERSGSPEAPLTIVSDHTPGQRLSELLADAQSKGVPIDIGAALCLIRQLVPAIAILQETARDASHGAIAPERLVVTPQARLIVTEYVLGSALEQLLFPRERYWLQLRVPLPRVAGLARFDHLADVAQIGVVALALILGRRLQDEDFPARTADLMAGATARSVDGEEEPLAPALVRWLERALQLDPRQSFPTAVEARTALDRAVDESGYDTSPAHLEAFLARLAGEARPAPRAVAPRPAAAAAPAPARITPPAETPSPAVAVSPGPPPVVSVVTANEEPIAPAPSPQPPVRSTPVPVTAAPAVAVAPVPPPAASLSPAPAAVPTPRISPPTRTAPTSLLMHSDRAETEVPIELAAASASTRSRTVIGAAVAVVLLVGSAGTFAARQFFASPKAAAATTGSLSVTTSPAGAQMLIDGAVQGTTPATIELAAGPHTLVVRGAHGLREVPVTIVAGSRVAQFLDLPQPAPAAAPDPEPPPPVAAPAAPAPVADGPVGGWISVGGAFDVQVFESGKLIGSNQSDRIMVAAGGHELELVNNELGYRTTRKVDVAPGKTAAVAIDVPKGTLALNALPWAEVTIDGQAAGETPLGNVSLPIGQHDVVFRHPEFGEQRHRVAVTLKAPARLSVDLRKK